MVVTSGGRQGNFARLHIIQVSEDGFLILIFYYSELL
jgi:hypothetical protein